jgi:hypothetical protein
VVKPKPKARAKAKKNDPYMNKVVDLLDDKGNVIFRGTRRECLRYSRETYEERHGPKPSW